MDPTLVTVAGVLGNQALTEVALTLRLRWQAMRDQRRQDTNEMCRCRPPACRRTVAHRNLCG